jgi:hypothetical protein
VTRPTRVELIVAGGQTGCDQAALRAAQSVGLPTGGWAPHNWLTEHGPDPSLARFSLREHPEPGYPPRTRANVRDTDATLLVGDRSSPGSLCTLAACRELGRHFRVVGWTPDRGPEPSPAAVEAVRAWLVANGVRRLNVAGNRESRAPGIGAATEALIRAVLGDPLRAQVEAHPVVVRVVAMLGGRIEVVEEVGPARVVAF